MYVFERAAEFKGRTERLVIVTAKASVRCVVTATTSVSCLHLANMNNGDDL
jgi:hypothetical protein